MPQEHEPASQACSTPCINEADCRAARKTNPEWRPIPECEGLQRNACPLEKKHQSIRGYIASNKPAIGRMVRGVFEIATLDEAEKLATMLASHCPEPDRAAIGIWELLANAIEHGNLEIDFETKSRLLMQGQHHAEIERRLCLPQFRYRVARVVFQHNRRSIRLRIEDQGKGFDFEKALAAPRLGTAPNGRGLLLARTMTFSKLRFRGAGNIVDATIDLCIAPRA